jgi:hypothetical protein
MPLTLVTGPANAEKAGHVLAAYRAALDREPLLVVPTAADVERYRRELAAAGAVFGARVMRFAWLESEIAGRAGIGGRPLGGLARERVATAVTAALVPICLEKSKADPSGTKKIVAIKAMTSSYDQRDAVLEGGWATFGKAEGNTDVAEACVAELLKIAVK